MNIYKQNDVMLYIQIGNGHVTESWTIKTESKEINANNGIVYEDDIGYVSLTYYPDGSYVEFENSEGLLTRKYYSAH